MVVMRNDQPHRKNKDMNSLGTIQVKTVNGVVRKMEEVRYVFTTKKYLIFYRCFINLGYKVAIKDIQ